MSWIPDPYGKVRHTMFVVILVGVGITALLVMVGIASLSSGSRASANPVTTSPQPTAGPSSTTRSTSTTRVATTRPAVATTITSSVRTGTLFSNLVTLRSAPRLDPSTKITNLEALNGAEIEILSNHQNGWYRIRLDQYEGWIFGTFVLPSDPEFFVAQTADESTATLLRSDGSLSGIDNASGSKVLVTDSGGSLWQVLLPTGQAAWVDSTQFRRIR